MKTILLERPEQLRLLETEPPEELGPGEALVQVGHVGVCGTDLHDYVAHGGRLVFVGLFQGDVTFHDPDFHRRELTLLSSRNATREDFVQVIQTLEAGKIDLAPWITNRARPGEVVEEFPRWFEPESNVVKALLEF